MRTLALAAGLFAQVVAVHAADFGFTGRYGNETGCAFLKDPSQSSELMQYLVPEAAASYAEYCGFNRLVERGDKRLVIDLTCGYEGGGDEMDDRVTITFDSSGAAEIAFSAGTTWGPLVPCQ